MTRLLTAAVVAMLCASSQASFQGNLAFGEADQVLTFTLTDFDDPRLCPQTDLTHDTAGLEIRIRADNTAGWYDTFTVTGTDDLEANTTVGTHNDPSDLTAPGTARFGVIAAGSCIYELDLPTAFFEISGSQRLYAEFTDGGTLIMDETHWWDLTGVGIDTFNDELLSYSTVGYTGANTVGKILGEDIPNILTDTGTTLDAKADTISAAVVTNIPASIAALELPSLYTSAVADGGVTSTTILVADEGPDYNDAHIGRSLCVYDADVAQVADCAVITDYVASTPTWTIANALDFVVEDGDALFVFSTDSTLAFANANTLTAAAAASDLTTELQAGLATAAALATVDSEVGVIDGVVDTVAADLTDIDGRIPTVLQGGRMDSYLGATGTAVITASTMAADSIGASEIATAAVTEIQTGLATATAVADVQTDTDNIQTRLPAALEGGRMDSSVGAMEANVLTASALATDAATELRDAYLDFVLGTYDTEDVTVACAMIASLSIVGAGEMDNSGGGPTLTFKTPDGVTTLAVVTMAGNDRVSSVITCPE